MVSLFFIIALTVTIFFVNKYKKKGHKYCCGDGNEDGNMKELYAWIAIIAGVASIFLLVWVAALIITVGNGYTIDNKIAMYEKENASIEKNIDVTIRDYMDSELKSDTLVQKQIEVYVTNNDKIRQLKEKKIDLANAKWKLYFGR